MVTSATAAAYRGQRSGASKRHLHVGRASRLELLHGRRAAQRQRVSRRGLAGEPDDAQGIRPVRRDLEIEHGIIDGVGHLFVAMDPDDPDLSTDASSKPRSDSVSPTPRAKRSRPRSREARRRAILHNGNCSRKRRSFS